MIAIVVSLLLAFGPVAQLPDIKWPEVPIPTAVPEPEAFQPPAGIIVPIQDIQDNLVQADSNLQQAPSSITAGVLPANQTQFIFGYAKWLLSINAANEILGPFGQLVTPVYSAIGLAIFIASIYTVMFFAVAVIRFANWVYTQITRVIP
ncbi:MAG: hypothetical protein SF162_01230 [bacterium]|nr:hypothetical protein [bacterium]